MPKPFEHKLRKDQMMIGVGHYRLIVREGQPLTEVEKGIYQCTSVKGSLRYAADPSHEIPAKEHMEVQLSSPLIYYPDSDNDTSDKKRTSWSCFGC